VVFGPYCTQILADLGADVIKIEAPQVGDAFRWSGRPAVTPGMSPGFMAINRGKQSVALDLKAPDDAEAMKALLADADVFVLNVRGKAAQRLGLDYEAVKAINPEIVYAHCVGFGQDGPYADLQAYDDVIQAATGTETLLPRVAGNPRTRYLPSLIEGKVAGLHGAYGVLAAIIHKLRTGRGQQVEIPMFEAFANFMLLEHLGGLSFDPPNGPVGYFRQIDPDRQPFPTADGYISIVAYTDEAWPRIFALLGEPQLLDDDRFADRRARAANTSLLYREMARLTRSFTTVELVEKCHAAQIPAQAVRDIGDILDDPHLEATEFFKRYKHPSEGSVINMTPPVRFGDATLREIVGAPRLGEHNERDPAKIGQAHKTD
jgi:crotonobetainyl-CoA:carnitine CoA-transferase CaiB-like acyl-CoA transferase